MPKVGEKGFRGPVQESVRNSPLGALVQKKKKKRKRKHDVKSDIAKNRAKAAKDTGDWTYVDTEKGRVYRKKTYAEKSKERGRKPPSRAAVDAGRGRSAGVTRSEVVAKTKAKAKKGKKKTKAAVNSTVSGTKVRTGSRRPPTRSTPKPRATANTSVKKLKATPSGKTSRTRKVGAVAARVAARSGMSGAAARGKARQIVQDRKKKR